MIVSVFLHRMLESAASSKRWYVSTRVDGITSQNITVFILLVQTKLPTFLSCCTHVIADFPQCLLVYICNAQIEGILYLTDKENNIQVPSPFMS
jgi:hypothetical protein